MNWAAEEFGAADLGDKRLNARLVKLAGQLADKPMASIPTACGGWGDTAAAYRLFDNERCDWREIIESHKQCAVQRMGQLPLVLCIQDTTELNFNGQGIEGLGPLSYEAQRGMYVHPTYAVSADREPLGVLDAWMWAREFQDDTGQRGGVCESLRWVEGYERLAELASQLPQTRLVQLGDRESDILALMARAQALDWPVDLLVRAQHDRVLPDGQRLWARIDAAPELGGIQFMLRTRMGHKARPVRQQLRVERVRLAPDAASPIEMTCLVAREIDPPEGEAGVCWRLLTNRTVTRLPQAIELIEWYRARWEIELFFHILKNGCRIEALQLGHVAKIKRALALYMVVSWRIDRLMRLGRTCPDLPAELAFDPDEIKAAHILNKKPLPKTRPRLNEVLRLVARLGGFLGRKGDGQPGVKVIWLGLQRVADFASGIRYMRDAQTQETCV